MNHTGVRSTGWRRSARRRRSLTATGYGGAGGMPPRRSEIPPETDGPRARALPLVEAVRARPRLARVELQMRRAAVPRPRLRGVEQVPADPERPVLRVDGEVLDPGTAAEADGLD